MASTTKPTILLILEGGYPWYFGGVSEWTHQYLKNLSEFNFNIIQFVNEPWLTASLEEAIYSLPDNISSFKRIESPALDTTVSYKGILEWITKQRNTFSSMGADLIHATNTGFAGLFGSELANYANKPLLLTEHAIYWKEIELGAQSLECGYQIASDEDHNNRLKQIFKQISRKLYQSADDIISVSTSNLPWQKKLGATNIKYIPNGVSADFFEGGRDIHRTADSLAEVGWIGRCANIKRPLVFLDIAKALNETMGKKIRFRMLLSDSGEQPLKNKVLAKSKGIDNLTLFWNEPADNHLSAMDALFITSQSESQPLVMLEALAKKVLPFGWEIGDATQKYGIFEQKNISIQALVNQFKELWALPDKWKEEVESRYAYVDDVHRWEHIFDQYNEIMHQYV